MDAAYGADGDGYCGADLLQGLMGYRVCVGFSGGGKNSAHAQIICAIFFRLAGLLHRLRGYSQYFAGADSAAHIRRRHVVLAHMNAVRAAADSQLYVIVNEERDMVSAAEFFHSQGFLPEFFLRQLLFPKLDAGGAA